MPRFCLVLLAAILFVGATASADDWAPFGLDEQSNTALSMPQISGNDYLEISSGWRTLFSERIGLHCGSANSREQRKNSDFACASGFSDARSFLHVGPATDQDGSFSLAGDDEKKFLPLDRHTLNLTARTVPEPASLLLLGAGLLAVVWESRQKSRR